MDGVADNKTDEGGTDDNAQQLQGQHLYTSGTATVPKRQHFFTATANTHEYPKEGRANHDGEPGCDDVGPRLRQHTCNERLAVDEHQGDDGQTEHAVDEDDDGQLSEAVAPKALLLLGLWLLLVRGIAFQLGLEPLWQHTRYHCVSWFCQSNHIRCGERGKHRHCNDDGIEEVAGDMERRAERGEDEGELTDLRQRERTLHSGLQRLSSQEESARTQDGLSQHDRSNDAKDGHDVLGDECYVDHHADGHEENGTKEVFNGCHKVLDGLGLDGLGQDAAHDEGAKSC